MQECNKQYSILAYRQQVKGNARKMRLLLASWVLTDLYVCMYVIQLNPHWGILLADYIKCYAHF